MKSSLKYRAPRWRYKLRRRRPGSTPGKLRLKKAAATLTPGAERPARSRRISRVGKHWLSKPAVIYRGEREICNPATAEGCAEYKYRTLLMWLRQDSWCCFHEYDFCPGRLALKDATFEHENGRTGGKRDDRIWLPNERRPLNGAAHLECNSIAGSRKLPIDHGTNFHYELTEAA